MEHKTCTNCGVNFRLVDRRHSGRYCSAKCYNENRTGKPRGAYVKRENRNCPICGIGFVVGGRDYDKTFCSNACSFKARYRRGRIATTLSSTQAAYLAGLIDGEGSIVLYMRRDVVAMRVMVSNTHRGVLDWIQSLTGVGQTFNTRPETALNKASFQWWCNADAAESVIKQIHPYLIIKKTQAELALETQERLRNPQLKADRLWQAEYRLRMKALNRRGPVAK